MNVYTYENAVHSWLDRPIAYHRVFVELTGSVQAAIMLSQAIYWSKRTKDSDGWFYKTASDWEDETGLTRREQDTARKHLKETGFWIEKLKGVPATTNYKVDHEKLYSSLNKTAKVDYTKGDIQFEQKSQASSDKTAKHSITETTTETTSSESKDSVPKESLFSDSVPEIKKKKENKKKKVTSDEFYPLYVKAWIEAYPELGFDGVSGRKIKSLITRTNTYLTNSGKEVTPQSSVNAFLYVLAYIKRDNHFCHGKPISTLDSQYLSIIFELKNGKPTGQKKQSARDYINSFK